MRQYKEILKEDKELVGVTCNCCGDEFNKQNHNGWEDYAWVNQIHNFGIGFGYGSNYDTQSWKFDLCESCLFNIIKTFEVVPDGFSHDMLELNEESRQLVFDNWKETDEIDLFIAMSYEDIAELQGYFHEECLNNAIKKYYPEKPLLEKEKRETKFDLIKDFIKYNK